MRQKDGCNRVIPLAVLKQSKGGVSYTVATGCNRVIPLAVLKRMEKGSYHLHGHQHNKLQQGNTACGIET